MPKRRENTDFDETLFDAAANFTRALERSRIARGEPPGGRARELWELSRWIRQNREMLALSAMAAVGTAVAGSIFLRRAVDRRLGWPRLAAVARHMPFPAADDSSASLLEQASA